MKPTTRNKMSLLLLGLFISACGSDDADPSGKSKSGSIDLTISGEDFGTDGFLFPTGSEATLADGWELQLTHVLITVGKVTLSANPDKAPTDQSQVDGVIATADGPWAVDLHVPGTAAGAGGEGLAVPLTTITGSFEGDQRYAFSYDILPASANATKVNFAGDGETEALYETMVTKGYTVLYAGTAMFKGTTCESSDPNYDFTAIPTSIPFELGFATPVTNINCQNQENQGDAFDGEEFQRGIPIKSNTSSLAQMTVHLDHPFFSDVEHDPAIYFDQIAAVAVGQAAGTVVTLDSLVGIDPTAFVDGSGAALPWRVCDGSALPAGAQRGFAVGSVPVNPTADPGAALRDYRDYVQYLQSTQGHLNGGEGLCFVKRNYPSPP
jgi:hypothetical protein